MGKKRHTKINTENPVSPIPAEPMRPCFLAPDYKPTCRKCGQELNEIMEENRITFACNTPECVEERRKAAEERRPFLEKYATKPVTEYGQFDCFVNMEFHEENMFNPDGAGDSLFYGRVEELMDFTGVRVLIGPDIKKPEEAIRCLKKIIDWIEIDGIKTEKDMTSESNLALEKSLRPNVKLVR
jgi:hypothetical protein